MKNIIELIKNLDKSNFKIFNSPAIRLNRKVHDPNFSEEEKKQLRTIFRLLLNEYLLDHFKWQPEKEVREVIGKIPHRIFLDRRLKLETYVGKYYLPLMKKSDRFQHLVQQTDLRTLPDKTVGDLLQLEVPIDQHPVFHDQNDHTEETPQPRPQPDIIDRNPNGGTNTEDTTTTEDATIPTNPTNPDRIPRPKNDLNTFIARLTNLTGSEKTAFVTKHKGQLLDKKNAKALFSKEIQETTLDSINYAKGLLEFTKGNRTLTEYLHKLPKTNSVEQLAQNKNLNWEGILKDHFGDKLSEKAIQEKTEDFDTLLADSFPTAYTTSRVQRKSNLLTTFINANPDIDILSAKMGRNEIEKYNWTGIPLNDRKSLINEIRTYQRVKFLTEDTRQIPTLLNAGFTSAQDIVQTNRRDFYEKSKLPTNEAKLIYKRAQDINNETLTALNLHLENQRNTAIPFINTKKNEDKDDDLDYQDIFGALNFCECEHCNSVLSPAAYLVDLLNFIKTNNNSALQELKRRRPDIWNIKLNCDKTNTTQPYLELILEVLGTYMVAEAKKLGLQVKTIEDVLYMPWVNPELPFEPNCIKARMLAEELDTSLFDIYRSMQVEPTILIAEYLGLGPETLKWTIQGQPLPNTSPQIYPANTFAQLFNLTFEELKTLSNSNIGAQIQLQAIKLDIQSYREEVKINLSTPQLRAAYLKEVFTFLRIYRHLSYDFNQLDFYLDMAAVGSKNYSAAHLANFSALMYLKDTFALSDGDLTVFVKGYEDSDIEFDSPLQEDDLETLSKVVTLLGVNEQDLNLLIEFFKNDLDFDGGDLSLKTDNLSLLKRTVYWAKGADMSIKEWMLFMEFYGIKELVVKNAWKPLLAKVLQHQQIGIPVELAQFYLKNQENEQWFYRITQQMLLDWFGVNRTNGTKYENLDGFYLSLAGLLTSDEGMVQALFEHVISKQFPDEEANLVDWLNQLISDDIDPSESIFQKVFQVLKFLDKNLQLLSHFEYTGETLQYFLARLGSFNLQVNSPKAFLTGLFNFSKWMKITQNDLELAELLLIEGMNTGAISDEQRSLVQDFFGLEFSSIIKVLDLFTENPSKLGQWNRFENAIAICSEFYITPSQLNTIVQTESITNAPRKYYQEVASFLEQSLELHPYSDDKKQEITDKVNDYVLETKRDALVALLKKSIKVDFSSTAKIYEYFLLDVETSACADVSPIKAAILSVQLFIQRCLMNLEEGENGIKLQFDDDDKKEWEWRKNYRVWEVNRKIFLYPENYLDPNLRDDKTPIYEELEGDIQQRDISLPAIEKTYRRYLKEFSVVAKLAMSGSFYDASTKQYFYFGRTASIPYNYYYRTYKKSTRAWSPWHSIDVKIESDYLTGINSNGRFYIFWKTTEKFIITKVKDGNATTHNKFKHFINYAYMQEDSSWSKPIKIDANVEAKITTLDYLEVPADATEEEIAAAIHVDNIWAIVNFNYDNKEVEDFSTDDFKHDSYLYVEKATMYGNCFRVRMSDTIGLDPNTDHTSETDVIINYYEDEYVDKIKIGNGFESKFALVSTKVGIQGVLPNYNDPEDTWNYTEHYRMNRRSGMDHDFKWNSLTTNGEYVVTKDNKNLSVINGTSPNNYIIKNKEKYYQYLFGNGGIYSMNSYVVNDLSENLFVSGIDSLLSPSTQLNNTEITDLKLGNHIWGPNAILMPEKGLDFDGPNGIYFKELYFHIPFTLAKHYNQNQKYEEADYWFKKIFDPTVEYEVGEKFWQYTPFRKVMEELMSLILEDTAAIAKYHSNPFNPHAIARLRTSSYPKAVVMSYIDNLLDWGDHLFRQDTYETINEAMMLYITAQQLLGDRPRSVAACDTANENATFSSIESELTSNNEILIEVESYVTEKKLFELTDGKKLDKTLRSNLFRNTDNERSSFRPKESDIKPGYNDATMTQSLVQELFCIPWNDTLMQYWETVEDRMFKIRNCLNIDGEYRQLALFEPPIDPMLLVKARAAGISLSQLTSQDNTLPYRFTYLLEKAKSFTQMVQGFGQTLLSTMEKEDGAALNELRSVHERNILEMVTLSKEKRIEELTIALENLQLANDKINMDIEHYTTLMSNDFKIGDGIYRSAATLQEGTKIMSLLASILALTPQVGAPTAMTFGGIQLNESAGKAVNATQNFVEYMQLKAQIVERFQNQKIRNLGWQNALNNSEKDLETNQQSKLINQIQMAIAERDLEIHERNIDQNQEILDFYADKMTNEALYNLMAGHLNRLFRDAYGLAFQTALDAQAAYRFELNDGTASFLAYDNWDTASMGLLSAEKLQYQLMKMETAYMEKNTRKAEVRSHVSLAVLDANALLNLKGKGNCSFKIPEAWFDIQYPGQYKRRIKSVSLTIPCVTGPYVNVACKLKLKSSRIRTQTTSDIANEVLSPAPKLPDGNDRIFTSTAQNDSGVLEFSFRDERYLPFEGAGVDSEWELKLPNNLRSFDYNTITDAIMHINYTAEYDEGFRTAVEDSITSELDKINDNGGLIRVLSLKHEFPNEWYHALNGDGNMILEIRQEHFPFFAKRNSFAIDGLELKIWNMHDSEPSYESRTIASTGNAPLTVDFNINSDEYDKELFLVVNYKL